VSESPRPPEIGGILTTIGRTPLVPLKRLLPDATFRLYAKVEAFNAAGSVKDRAALQIIVRAMERGELRSGGTVIESRSGNMGVGLAQVCAYFGVPFICVVDAKTTALNVALLRAYGARVEIVSEPDSDTGEFLDARLKLVRELTKIVPGAYWPNQYANEDNALAQRVTMEEVVDCLGRVDYIVCAVSTCGTLRGCADFVRSRGLATRVWAVDALGSAIFESARRPRLLPGHGASQRPALFNPDLADDYTLVSDSDCVAGCRELLRREAILAGASSGGVISAVTKRQHEIARDAVCVVILADRGDRYLDTVFNNEWVERHLAGPHCGQHHSFGGENR
jgi:N-(2-amino-2-carboxyethyl)-L-glutamate synthase